MPNEALIVVDMQNDFCDGGALAVPGANAIVPLVNRLIGRHDHVVLTQDWHPAGPCLVRQRLVGRRALQHRAVPLRPADPVAGPLRAGHAGRGVPSRARCRPRRR